MKTRVIVGGGGSGTRLLLGIIVVIGVCLLLAILVFAAFASLILIVPVGLFIIVSALFRRPKAGKGRKDDDIIDIEYSESKEEDNKLLK